MADTEISWRILGELLFFSSLVAVSELVRLVIGRRCPDSHLVGVCLTCSLALGWYSTSITLVLLNKWVLSSWMDRGIHFPILYTMTHMVLKGMFAVVYLLCIRCHPLPTRSWRVLRIAFCIGILVGIDVVASNLSFQYVSVTFYVMVKASAPIWILAFGRLAKVEAYSPQIAVAIFAVACGFSISMYGEVDFNATGFCLVMASEVFAAARWVSTQVLLADSDIDAVTAVLYMSPGSTLSLLPLVLVREHGEFLFLFDSSSKLLQYAMLVVIPSSLAFGLLILEVRLVQETSSLTLAVLGNLKSLMTVLFAIIVFKESATPIQWCGLTIGTVGMLWYSYSKNTQILDGEAIGDAKYNEIPQTQSKELRCTFLS